MQRIASKSVRASASAVLLLVGLSGCATDEQPETRRPAGDAGTEQRPNVVIISLDTTRRDHLSLYGYGKATTPFIDEVAADGWVFERAFTVDTNTNPAHATLLTGLYPHEHGSQANGMVLDPTIPTLAVTLDELGYRTGAFVSGAPLRDAASGLGRGFQVYEDQFDGPRRNGRDTVDLALEWLDEEHDGQPLFLFVHLYDAHGPYLPTAEELDRLPRSGESIRLSRIPKYQQLHGDDGEPLQMLGAYVDRYDALLRRQDALVAELFQELDLDNTYVLITSDHGETFAERWYQLDHGAQVYEEQIRIPMVLVGPGLTGKRLPGFVSLVDFVPSIVARLGWRWPGVHSGDEPGFDGRNWFDSESSASSVFATARAGSERYAHLGYELVVLNRIHTVRDGSWKLIQFPGREGDEFQLFDLDADPRETHNLVEEERVEARRLFGLLREWNPGYRDPVRRFGLSDQLREQLESLGYLE